METNVIQWSPKKTGKGCFMTRVPSDYPGAVRVQGVTASNVPFDYYGFTVSQITGKLVWVDKKENGKFGQVFLIALKNDKGMIHIIEAFYNASHLKSFLNRLLMANKAQTMSVGYFSFEKQDKNGSPVMSDTTKKPIIESTFLIHQGGVKIPAYYTVERKMPESTQWVDIVVAGKKVKDSTPEITFWEKYIMAIQKELLASGQAVPFTYNSLICGALDNPTGAKQTGDIIEKARAEWEKVKANYKFQWQTEAQGRTSDDFSYNPTPERESVTAQVYAPPIVPPMDAPFDISSLDDSEDLPF